MGSPPPFSPPFLGSSPCCRVPPLIRFSPPLQHHPLFARCGGPVLSPLWDFPIMGSLPCSGILSHSPFWGFVLFPLQGLPLAPCGVLVPLWDPPLSPPVGPILTALCNFPPPLTPPVGSSPHCRIPLYLPVGVSTSPYSRIPPLWGLQPTLGPPFTPPIRILSSPSCRIPPLTSLWGPCPTAGSPFILL